MQNAVTTGDQYFGSFITNIVSPLYGLALGASLAYFLFGVAMFIWKMNDEEARSKGKMHLLYGAIGLFIIFSIGGIFSIFTNLMNGIVH